MKKIVNLIRVLFAVSLMAPAIARADTILEFVVKERLASAATTQTVIIKDGKIMVKAVGSDRNLDFLYSRADEKVVMVDHRKKTRTTIDEAQVDRINQQAQGVQPLLQGLGSQIAKLSPEQRRKWQELLGDTVSLDEIAKGSEPPVPTRLVPIGVGKAAGIRCQTMRVVEGETPMAELCLAEPAVIKIPANDYAAIRALLRLYERLAAKSQRLAGQLGLAIPAIALQEVAGIPIAVKDLSREDQGSITLSRIRTSPLSPDLLWIPSSYAAESLTLWK